MSKEMRGQIDKFNSFINENKYQEYLKRQKQQPKVDKVDEYSDMTNYVRKFNMIPYDPYLGAPQGIYTLKNHTAPVDLRNCEMNDISILKQAFLQLSEKCDEFISDRREGNF